jgi:hypothetical protein
MAAISLKMLNSRIDRVRIGHDQMRSHMLVDQNRIAIRVHDNAIGRA